MEICPFYKVEIKTLKSKQIKRDRSSQILRIPWCAHEQSPIDLKDAMIIGGAKRLKCGGDLDKCQIEV